MKAILVRNEGQFKKKWSLYLGSGKRERAKNEL